MHRQRVDNARSNKIINNRTSRRGGASQSVVGVCFVLQVWMTAAGEGWDTMEDVAMVVTDVGVLSNKDKTPSEYTVVSVAAPFLSHSSLSFFLTSQRPCYVSVDREHT